MTLPLNSDDENDHDYIYNSPLSFLHSLQVYPYLVVNDTQVSRCRSEERVLQLLAMVNLCLEKNKVSIR